MNLRQISLIFSLCFIFNLTYGKIFSSTARLAEMFNSNTFIVQNLEQYILKEEARLDNLKSLKKDIAALKRIDQDSSFSLVEHPVGALRVLKTFHRLQREIKNGKKWTEEFAGALNDKGIGVPTIEDIDGAYNAILRLQRIYELKTEDLMDGIIEARQITGITANDAFEIGNLANNQVLNKHLAIQWWQAAIRQDASGRQLTPESRRELVLKLTSEHMELGHTVKVSVELNHTIHIYEADVEKGEKAVNQTSGSEDTDIRQNQKHFSAMCRGDPSVMVVDPFASFCILLPGSIAYDLIKVEVMSIDPFIVMFHDVISDKETSEFKEIAAKELEAAIVGLSHDAKVSEGRTAQMAWIFDETPIIEKVTTRVETLTGLESRQAEERLSWGSEPFQVVNYGIGGHYGTHLDYFTRPSVIHSNMTFPELRTGNRLATCLFYLNDVEEGGATVFPTIGVRIPPIKGSAAFWFNLHRSGNVDSRTLHAGCPVLLGQKWIANKWIKEHGQEFRHGCGLHVDDLHYRFDNRQN